MLQNTIILILKTVSGMEKVKTIHFSTQEPSPAAKHEHSVTTSLQKGPLPSCLPTSIVTWFSKCPHLPSFEVSILKESLEVEQGGFTSVLESKGNNYHNYTKVESICFISSFCICGFNHGSKQQHNPTYANRLFSPLFPQQYIIGTLCITPTLH